MSTSRADTAIITLNVGSLPDNTFKVLKYSGTEYISKCFNFQVTAAVEDQNLNYDDLIGVRASLGFEHNNRSEFRYGIIQEYSRFPSMGEGVTLEISIVPKLSTLVYYTQNRIFQNKSVIDIITEVLKDSGFSTDDFRDDTGSSYSKKEFTVQYNESNLNFIQRLMESEGIFYFFDHSDHADVLVLADSSSTTAFISNSPSLVYHPEVGMFKGTGQSVFEIRRKNRMITGKVTVKDYNHRTPESNIIGQTVNPGEGELYVYGSGVKTADESGSFSARHSEIFTAQKTRLYGRSDCRSMLPGYRYSLTDGSDSGFSGEYLIVAVDHQSSQEASVSGSSEDATFKNSFECIPADIPFRPPIITPRPEINGLITAKIDGPKGQYAFIDEHGQYKVKFPFDLSDISGGEASCPVRMTQPYTGTNYGIHFPVHEGTDIIVGFENGDINRPIGLGTAPNPSMGSPVNSKNKSENIIRTASGHHLKMDDLEKKTSIEIKTAKGNEMVLLDEEEKQSVRVKTINGNEMILDDKNENITIHTSDKKKSIILDNKNKRLNLNTEYGHLISMDDNKKSLSVQTKNGNLLQLNDKDKVITLKDASGKHTIQINGKSGAVLINTAGDLSMTAKGNLDIQAKEISMEAKQGGINVKAAKDIKADGMNINLKSKQKIQIEGGMDTGIKGKMNLKLEGGMNVESKAGIANKMTGTMVNAEAKAVNTVKGAVVMIN